MKGRAKDYGIVHFHDDSVFDKLCNRRVREDGQIPCSAAHTSQF